MLKLKNLLFLALGLIMPFSLANSVSLTGLTNEDLAYYVTAKNYPLIKIESNNGALFTESYQGTFLGQDLYNYYTHKICKNIYNYDCEYNYKNILVYTKLNLKIESQLINPLYKEIKTYKVVYQMLGLDNKLHRVSAGILIPTTQAKLKGVLLFYHFTVLNKENVPSNFKEDEFQLSKNLAATIASEGYVVVLPDYLGLGEDKASSHPYVLYPQINALSGIYLLPYLNQIESDLKFHLIQGKTPLMISGYSEGAAYALWASKILEDNFNYLNQYNYKLIHTIPIDGAYNLSQVTFPFMLSEVPANKTPPYYVLDKKITKFTRPGLVSNVLNSFSIFQAKSQFHQVFNNLFFKCVSCQINGEHHNINSLLNLGAREVVKYQLLYKAATNAGYGKIDNTILALINLNLVGESNLSNALLNADIYNYQAKTPVTFLTLEYDSMVPILNSLTAYYAMALAGSYQLGIKIIPNQNFKVNSYIPFADEEVDHVDGLTFELLFLRNILNKSI